MLEETSTGSSPQNDNLKSKRKAEARRRERQISHQKTQRHPKRREQSSQNFDERKCPKQLRKNTDNPTRAQKEKPRQSSSMQRGLEIVDKGTRSLALGEARKTEHRRDEDGRRQKINTRILLWPCLQSIALTISNAYAGLLGYAIFSHRFCSCPFQYWSMYIQSSHGQFTFPWPGDAMLH